MDISAQAPTSLMGRGIKQNKKNDQEKNKIMINKQKSLKTVKSSRIGARRFKAEDQKKQNIEKLRKPHKDFSASKH